jgi:hypothetical protein
MRSMEPKSSAAASRSRFARPKSNIDAFLTIHLLCSACRSPKWKG